MPLFLILAFLGVAAGGVLTGFQAAEQEPHYRPRRALPRAHGPRPGARRATPEPRGARPSTPPGTTAIRSFVTPPAAAPRSAAPARVVVDPRLQGILVGMGFKVPEAKEAIGKLTPSVAAAPLGDQVKGALALLSK